jgi:DNA mismatch repair protein MutS2
LEKARQKASQLVDRTRAQIDSLLNEMEEIKKQRSRTLSAEQKAKLKFGLRSLENTADPVSRKEEEGYRLPRPLKVGDTVRIYDIDKKATVLRLPEGSSQEVLVQAGILQTRVPLSNLRLIREKPSRPVFRTVTKTSGLSAPAAQTEIDLRGQTAEEALMNVDRFIDSAVLSGVGQLTIIHGKGTGVLRAAIHQHLKSHPNVKSYRLGTFGEGESGVTIVELK